MESTAESAPPDKKEASKNILNNVDAETNDEEFITIEEGRAKILMPKCNRVFYNPVQEFNRDLTVAVIKLVLQKRRERILVGNCETTARKEPCQEEGKLGLSVKSKSSDRIKEEGVDFNKALGPTDDYETKEHFGDQFASPIENETTTYLEQSTVLSNKTVKNKVLDALSATGLRALRYGLEIDEVDQVIANDLSATAVESIERNIIINKIGNKVCASKDDAGLLMYKNRFPPSERFQVIDIDPYGSPAQFLDAAIQAVDEGGLLCVTCTDMAGLCGNHGEASFAKYGCMPLHGKFCHEMALRVVLCSLEHHAARYKRYIVPLLSLSADFYIRLFVLVFTSASEVKRSASKQSYVYMCNGCESFHLQAVGKRIEDGNRRKYNPGTGPVVNGPCVECGQRYSIGGPIWAEPIHQTEFVKDLREKVKQDANCYKTHSRLMGTLSLICEELETAPLYFLPDRIANIVHCSTPSKVQVKSALLNLGYKVSGTHANSNAVKTDAPSSVIWDILRCWVKMHPVKRDKLKPNSPAFVILSKEAKIQASFKYHEAATPDSRKSGLVRYPKNPEPNWGPKARAKQSDKYVSLSEKRQRLQCKRTKKIPKDNLKQFPCKRFKEGVCDLGDNCCYSHEDEAAEEVAQASGAQTKASGIQIMKTE